ncbi:Mediator of RNA polymerase II transcription subunit 13-like [Mactra antiquata]
MSGPTPTGNSCSLEDCYTNIFALTDICGIKWRKLCIEPSQTHIDPLDDPVLSSYARCLQADILCVWRRVAKHSESRPTDISFGKELWLFWYGDQPSVLEEILSPDLKEHEYGSWEKDSVLSYECRTLLFKALHNLIERCLLTKNFIRLGRWFVQPHDPLIGAEQSGNLSFCFNFFLHGESTVCASIEVKQHPPVTCLNIHHINHTQENGTHLNVILAPYGLNGTLTGVTYRDCDVHTDRYHEEWQKFYPIKFDDAKDDPNKLPNFVEVIVAGVRMKYPSCYVLLVDDRIGYGPDHNVMRQNNSLLGHQGLHDDGLLGDGGPRSRILEPVSELTSKTNRALGSKLVERISQDSCITAGLSKKHSENMTEEMMNGTWDFSDPTSKTSCNCTRLRGKNKATGGIPGKPLEKKKSEKTLERQQSRLNRTTPFHRRNQLMEEYVQYDMDMFMPRAPISSVGLTPSGTQVSVAGTTSVQQIPQGPASTDATNVCSANIESPASNAPSPLEDSHNHSQMENVASMDPTMPTLSPHPPVLKTSEKESVPKISHVDPNLSQNVNVNNSTVLVNGVTSDTNPFHKPHSVLKQENITLSQPVTWAQQSLESTKANINSWLRSQQKQVDYNKSFKRPCLPTTGADNDDLVTMSLYNFDSVSNWSEYPLKKVCYDRTELMNGIQDLRSSSNSGQNHRPLKSLSPQPPAPDPYAFSDESSSTPATISRGSMRNSREDLFQKPFKDEEKPDVVKNGNDGFGFKDERSNMDFNSIASPPTTPGTQMGGGSLTRDVDLKPNISDLDNLFETDSDSNDDAFVAHSPPKSMEDTTKSTKLPNTGPVDAIGVIAPSELSRMYPTPPSLENNPALSPMTSTEAPMETHTTVIEGINLTSIITEVPVGNSLVDELSKDGLSVYKPDVQAHFPSSSKYAPVDLYSTQLSPPPQVPVYKPWQYTMPVPDKHVSQYMNIPSVENLASISSARMPSSAIEASPAMFQNSVGQQRTPMSYELQSPASNASSYLNKTPNSNINHNIGTNNQIPEAHSLLVNVVLSDSILSLFKDHNFDSCNICVCNMTIKGSDLGVYIPNPTGEQEYKCLCGFSAVMNKKYGHFAGLFYEDEVEITGVHDNRFETRKPNLLTLDSGKVDENSVKVIPNIEEVSQSVIQLLIGQFCVPYRTCSTLSLLDKLTFRSQFHNNTINIVHLQDGNDVTYMALDQGRQAMEHCPNKLEDRQMKSTCLHKWTYLQGASQIPQNSLECVRLLKGLQPILQDAIQNKRVTRLWEHTYKLQGPLTWIEFHQLAGRGSDENSEPQPIPSLLVGCEKDSANISPYTLRYWDKNILEPYGHRRDVAYVIVTPENDHIMGLVKPFFKELGTMYEWLKLGKHCPISEKLRDGILRVGRTMLQKLGEQDVDDWFKHIGDNPVASKLKLYAQTCKHYLGPFLAQQTDFKTMFAQSAASQRPSNHRPPEPSATSDSQNTSHSDDRDGSHGDSTQRETHEDIPDTTLNGEGPAIVIYMVNPFTYGHQEWDDLNRLAMIGLLNCYQEIVQKLPDFMQNNVYLQIIPVQTIIDAKESSSQFQLLKNIAFSVFTSCRWNLTHSVLGRSLTGFGPAAAADVLLKRRDPREGTGQYKLYNPPFILAPVKDKQEQLSESCNEKRENSTILMCVYCLSEDQRWLLACCTDDQGETVETCTINIDIPNRHRRKKTSARKIGLGKLWEFILGVVSMSSKPCRIVIGRFGRMGHGELKGWSGLLSKKNIQRCSRKMKTMCSQCTYQQEGEHPMIVSACLTSFEQHRSFNIMPDCVKSEEKQRSNCPLQTPRDASCSHILVFPTSATAQANAHQIPLDSTGGIDLGGHNLEFGVDLSDPNIINDFENTADDFGSLMDVFVSMTENSPPGSPRQDNPGSPGLLDIGRTSPNKLNGVSVTTNSSTVNDPQDDSPNLLQQPLAMGYYISTAQTGPLPRWFWSSCPENEHLPVKCFKSALHIHVSTNQDDFMHQTPQRNTHPLDSNLTCDVLRFVLEKYNSLSWLTFDPMKNDRQSCLPIHFNVLMQLYHAMNAYV